MTVTGTVAITGFGRSHGARGRVSAAAWHGPGTPGVPGRWVTRTPVCGTHTSRAGTVTVTVTVDSDYAVSESFTRWP